MLPSRNSTKRSNPSKEDDSQSDSVSTRDEEKTIPFLRRLTDMLIENEEFISFKPGSRTKDGQVILGKIKVHDRVKVESSILPRYFNHSSFASLRRQLNYFRFTRIGKGRQRGATYCNEAVVELEDILSLKRRSVTNNTNSTSGNGVPVEPVKNTGKIADMKRLEEEQEMKSKKEEVIEMNPNKRARLNTKSANSPSPMTAPDDQTSLLLPTRVSPVEHLTNDGQRCTSPPQRLSLDLTATTYVTPGSTASSKTLKAVPHLKSGVHTGRQDDDILAGCQALLCFSRGISSR